MSLSTLPRRLAPAALAALLAFPAAAEEPPAPAPVQPPAASETPPPAQLPAEPALPEVKDPLLAPVPRPALELASWDEARRTLLARSTDLRSAQAGVQRAEGRWRQSLSALLPNARATAGVGFDILNPNAPSFAGAGAAGAAGAAASGGGAAPTSPLGAATVSVTQSVLDLGAWAGVSSTEAGTRSAEASLADTHRRLTLGLARALVAVVSAERAAELNRVSLRQALERAALLERSFQLGAANQLDVVRVEQDVAVARSALIAGDEQVKRTREALGLALGVDGEAGVKPSFALDGLVEQARAQCKALEKLSDRPDLVAAREQVTAAAESKRQASEGYLPTVGASTSAIGLTTTPGPGKVATWNISLLVSVPIWEGGLRRGLVAERAANEEQARQSEEALARNVTFEVARARRATQVAEALLAAARQAEALAAKSDEMTRKSFQIGRATSLEVVQAAVVLRQASLNLALREFELVQARIDSFLTEARCDG